MHDCLNQLHITVACMTKQEDFSQHNTAHNTLGVSVCVCVCGCVCVCLCVCVCVCVFAEVSVYEPVYELCACVRVCVCVWVWVCVCFASRITDRITRVH